MSTRNVPKFSDRQILANSVDPDQNKQSDKGFQSASFNHMVKNFRIITSIFQVSEYLGILLYCMNASEEFVFIHKAHVTNCHL